MWNQDVLRLRSVDCVSELPSAERSSTLRPVPAKTCFALPTWRNRAHDDSLADLIAFDADAKLMDHANCFVPDCETFANRVLTADNVNIRAADRSQPNPDDCLTHTSTRNRLFFETEFTRPTKHIGLHPAAGKWLCLLFFQYWGHCALQSSRRESQIVCHIARVQNKGINGGEPSVLRAFAQAGTGQFAHNRVRRIESQSNRVVEIQTAPCLAHPAMVSILSRGK